MTSISIKWENIKKNISELNGNTKLSPIDKTPLNNELIMCLFCNKINLKYRFEPYYEVPFIDYTTRIFETVINLKDGTNFFEVAKKEALIKTYIESIKNVILTQIKISTKNDMKKLNELINNVILDKDQNIYDYILSKFDINLILVSAIENLDMEKYKILSKMLYNQNSLYLDYAKESIINSNKKISLDKMTYGIDLPQNKTELFSNNINYSNNLYLNSILIIIVLLVIIYILVQNLYSK